MLPHDLPPYRIVFHYYRAWQQVNNALRQQIRQRQGRQYGPPIVQTTEKVSLAATTSARK